MNNYEMSIAEEMFAKLGYYRYESKRLESVKYEKGAKEIVFLHYNQSFYAQINMSDTNFERFRPMEISVEIMECIKKQIEEFGWKVK